MRSIRLCSLVLATSANLWGCGESGAPSTNGGVGGSPALGNGGMQNGAGTAGLSSRAGANSTSNSGTGGSQTATTAGSATGGAPTTGGAALTGGTSSAGTLKKFCGNITTSYSNALDYNGLKYSKYWDQITPENAGKWGSVQSTASSAFNWSALDSIYSYTQTNGTIFKQHTFVWGSQQPSGSITAANVENWIKTFCQRYPNTKLIDVVNEPPPHTTPTYTANLGAGESGTYGWITKAFKLARQYCGSAILILNDYNNIEYSDQETHFISIVSDIKSHGAPIDAVGCQAHAASSLSASALAANLNTMNMQTGLPIYITEYDVSTTSDSSQLSTYQSQFPIFWSSSYIHGVTIWGWIVGQTWSQAPNSGLVNGTSPRSAMTWLMQQLGRPVPPN